MEPNKAIRADASAMVTRSLSPPELPGLEVLRLLGVGGRAAVWLTRPDPMVSQGSSTEVVWVDPDGELPAELAWKVPVEKPRSVASIRSAAQELEAMLPLAHGHLVRPWAITCTAGLPGVLMDAYTAGSLAQVLHSRGNLTLGELVTTLTPIASALEHLHRNGAAHADVSAGNILLSVEGRPALADLGDAGLLGMSANCGTAQDDVAGLAGVAWRALTGSDPGPRDRRAPLGAIQADVPARLVDLLEDCLGGAGEQRPTAGEFAAELYASADPTPLRLAAHLGEEALAEMPTQLSRREEPSPPRWTGLFGRFGRRAQRPNWASKFASSRRAFNVWRKRPASAPSTMRWS